MTEDVDPPPPAARREAPGDAGLITPSAFRPTARASRGAEPLAWLTAPRLLLAAVVLAAAGALWFVFTAKSVRFETTPAAAAVDVDALVALPLGDVHLLPRGAYRVRAAAAGYQPLTTTVAVGAERSQTVALVLAKLPGQVAFDIEPPGAEVALAGAEAPLGAAPLQAELAAGPHVAEVRHPRYQSATVAFDVIGKGQRQTVALALAPNWADIAIPTEPPGAAVAVDGADTGLRTPGPVPILAGERRVRVALPGYQPWTDILHVVAGQPDELPVVKLKPAAVSLRVASEPPGATITIDGSYAGETPLVVGVAPGRHALRASKAGYAAASKTVLAAAGGAADAVFALAPLLGAVAIETQPADAELWLDGERHGPAGGTVMLPARAHEVEIKLAGFASYRKTVVPQPGFTQELKVRLLTLEEARLEALKRVRRSSQGHDLVLLSPSEIRLGASRREPGRRANEVLRPVRLTRLFYLGRHEVTNRQFRAFAAGHSSGAYQGITLDQPLQPVVGVSWQEAALYCNWLSRQDGLAPFYAVEFGQVIGFDPSALGYRLPTEAEWAWAARHRADAEPRRFAWGPRLPPPERHGNYADRAAAHLVARTIFGYNDNYNVSAPVGAFAANAKGIHDLGGNVAEWTHDYYEIPEPAAVADPLGPAEGEYHVIRGASWRKGTITDLRLSFRDYGADGREDLGFRIARFAE